MCTRVFVYGSTTFAFGMYTAMETRRNINKQKILLKITYKSWPETSIVFKQTHASRRNREFRHSRADSFRLHVDLNRNLWLLLTDERRLITDYYMTTVEMVFSVFNDRHRLDFHQRIPMKTTNWRTRPSYITSTSTVVGAMVVVACHTCEQIPRAFGQREKESLLLTKKKKYIYMKEIHFVSMKWVHFTVVNSPPLRYHYGSIVWNSIDKYLFLFGT